MVTPLLAQLPIQSASVRFTSSASEKHDVDKLEGYEAICQLCWQQNDSPALLGFGALLQRALPQWPLPRCWSATATHDSGEVNTLEISSKGYAIWKQYSPEQFNTAGTGYFSLAEKNQSGLLMSM